MSERLEDFRKELVHEGALTYLRDKEAMREFVGPGGVKLNKIEQLQLYGDALNDPEMMMGIIQNRQEYHKMPPDQLPWDFVRWIERMQAMGASQTGDEESSQMESLHPNVPKQ